MNIVADSITGFLNGATAAIVAVFVCLLIFTCWEAYKIWKEHQETQGFL